MSENGRKKKGIINRKSVGFKFGLLIVLFLVVILGVKTFYDATKSYNNAIKQSEKISLEETRVMANKLETRFAAVYGSAEALKLSIENILEEVQEDKRNRELVISNLKSVFSASEWVDGVGIYFEPNAFDGKDRLFVSDVCKSGRFTAYVYGDMKNPTLDLRDNNDGQAWYERPIKEGRTVLLEPFVDGNDNFITTYALPIVKGGKTVGSLTFDMEVEDLQTEIEQYPHEKEDFNVLLSDKGLIVAHALGRENINKNVLDLDPSTEKYIKNAQDYKETVDVANSVTTGMKSEIIYVPVEVEGIPEN